MAKDYSEPKNVCIRLPPGLKKAVDEDVAETGDFNSASQWYIAAVRAYLEIRKKERTGGGGLTSLSKNNKKTARVLPLA